MLLLRGLASLLNATFGGLYGRYRVSSEGAWRGKRDAFWRELQVSGDEDVAWPETQAERERVARDIFGAVVVGAVEAVLEERLAVVNGRPPRAGRDDYEAEVARRATFDGLSEAQRTEVERELKRACFGSLYWILVQLDHYPSADADFTVTPYRERRIYHPAV